MCFLLAQPTIYRWWRSKWHHHDLYHQYIYIAILRIELWSQFAYIAQRHHLRACKRLAEVNTDTPRSSSSASSSSPSPISLNFGATKYWKSGGVGKSVKVSVQETRTWCNLAMWGHCQSQHCHVLYMIISNSCFEILKHWIEEKTSDHQTFFNTWSENLQISNTF